MQQLDTALILFGINIIAMIIAITRYHEKQSAKIDINKKEVDGKFEVIQREIDSQKELHKSLEKRFLVHEEKIHEKLDALQASINKVLVKIGGEE